jgi:hypothetical protein
MQGKNIKRFFFFHENILYLVFVTILPQLSHTMVYIQVENHCFMNHANNGNIPRFKHEINLKKSATRGSCLLLGKLRMGGSRLAETNSSWDPISKITKVKWTEVVAQVVGCLLCKHKAEFKAQSHPPTKKIQLEQ